MKQFILYLIILQSLLYAEKCTVCHGEHYEKKAFGISKIVRFMSENEIKKALTGYKDGTYGSALQDLMIEKLAPYSKDDIEKLVSEISKNFFSKKKGYLEDDLILPMKEYEDTIDKGTYIEIDTKTKQILQPQEYRGYQLKKLPKMHIPSDKREAKIQLNTKVINQSKKLISFDISTNIPLKKILLDGKKLTITNNTDYHYITRYRRVLHPRYKLTLQGKDDSGEFVLIYDCNNSGCIPTKKDEL